MNNSRQPSPLPPLPDVVVRHQRERKSKCSLEPLRSRNDIRFLTFRNGFSFDGTGYVLLAVDGPALGPADAGLPLLLLDSTWRLLPPMRAAITGNPRIRSLPPGVRTAYPRSSKITPDPRGGLASVEALYLARNLQGRPVEGLLEAYRWREPFLRQFSC